MNPIKPIVGSLRDLEFRLGVKREALRELLSSRSDLYRPFDLKKKRHPYPGRKRRAAEGIKFRRIDNPIRQLKEIQKRILDRVLVDFPLPDYMFGAVAGKTLTAHAARHVANQSSTLVKMDISSYYPNVTCAHVYTVWRDVLGCPLP
jgi:RNA-directed DNA polymerase